MMENTMQVHLPTGPGQDAALFKALAEKAIMVDEHAEVAHAWAHGVYIKQMNLLEKGWICYQHVHKYTHVTLVASGSVAVNVDDTVSYYDSPAIIEIRAGKQHQIMATADRTVCYCIHALGEGEDPDGLIQEVV